MLHLKKSCYRGPAFFFLFLFELTLFGSSFSFYSSNFFCFHCERSPFRFLFYLWHVHLVNNDHGWYRRGLVVVLQSANQSSSQSNNNKKIYPLYSVDLLNGCSVLHS